MSKKFRVAGVRLAWPNQISVPAGAGRGQRQVCAPGRLQDEIERAGRRADVVDDGPALRRAVQQRPGWFDNQRLSTVKAEGVDLDLAQVRAFVAAAEDLHFGRAAGRLFLTQQALSKRIARLERELGVALFTRQARAVRLTEAGHRFLAPARRALAEADRAVEAARDPGRPLRIDVWGHLYDPMRTVGQVVAAMPGLSTEIGHSRDLPAAVTALRRGEIDMGFGRVYPAGEQGQDRMASRLARLEPVDAIVSTEHPLAGRPCFARPTCGRASCGARPPWASWIS